MMVRLHSNLSDTVNTCSLSDAVNTCSLRDTINLCSLSDTVNTCDKYGMTFFLFNFKKTLHANDHGIFV